jgi:arsenate reductase
MSKNVLVLCTGNSCRSQMAHGFLDQYKKHHNTYVYSAGIETHGLNPLAVRVMADSNIDISAHTSNHVDEYSHIVFDLILTVCDHARENCPYIPGKALRIHHNFTDPSKEKGAAEEVLPFYRATRDEIAAYCRKLAEDQDL